MEAAAEKLAQAFRNVGDEEQARKAEAGYYGDFTSPLATPIMALVEICRIKGYNQIAERAKKGEFDG